MNLDINQVLLYDSLMSGSSRLPSKDEEHRDFILQADIWNHPITKPVIGIVKGNLTFFDSGSDIIYAGAQLGSLSKNKKPLFWAKRLYARYSDSAHPKTGLPPWHHTSLREFGSANDLLLNSFQSFPKWMWQNEVFRDLVEWMKQRNKAIKEEQKNGAFIDEINVYGLDLFVAVSSLTVPICINILLLESSIVIKFVPNLDLVLLKS